MDPNAWLETNAAGFSQLDQDEQRAIYHFALLWSLFEAKLLATHGSPGAILDAVGQVDAANRLDLESLAERSPIFVVGTGRTESSQRCLAASTWLRSMC